MSRDLTSGHVGGTSDSRCGSRKTLEEDGEGSQVSLRGSLKCDRFFRKLDEGGRQAADAVPCFIRVERDDVLP